MKHEAASKLDVRAIVDAVRSGDAHAVEGAVQFACAESVGMWHGRGRAALCRRLKHVPLTADQQTRLVTAIVGRLRTGAFSQQFRDQLRLALLLDRDATIAAGRAASGSPHVRRMAAWVLAHESP